MTNRERLIDAQAKWIEQLDSLADTKFTIVDAATVRRGLCEDIKILAEAIAMMPQAAIGFRETK